MQFTADVTGVELKVAEVAESSAWGAAMNGLLGLGICSSLDELTALPREVKSFRPQMKAAKAKQTPRRLAGRGEDGFCKRSPCETVRMLSIWPCIWQILTVTQRSPGLPNAREHGC